MILQLHGRRSQSFGPAMVGPATQGVYEMGGANQCVAAFCMHVLIALHVLIAGIPQA